jgi:hypothetical protein
MIVQELFSTLGLKVDRGSFAQGDKLLSAIKTGFAGIGIAFGLSHIAGLVQGVASMADSAVKASAKLGITVEAVQELGYAAKLSDIGQGELEGGLNRLAKGLDDVAQTGKGPTADALRRLGVSFADLKGHTLDENLGTIADAFAKMPDGAKKAAVANDVFGRNLGSKFIPLLNGGAAGLAELREEAQRLGVVVGDEAARKFEEFNDNQTRLSETWRGLKVQVVTALLPALTSLVEKVQGFITQNRELISAGLSVVIQAASLAFEGLTMALEGAFKVINFFTEGSDEAMAVLIGIAAVIVGAVVPALIKMIAGWVAAAAPFIAIGVIVAAIALGVIKLVKNWDRVKKAAGAAWNFIIGKAKGALNFIASIPEKILSVFSSAWEGIKRGAKSAFEWIANLPVVKQLIDLIKGIADLLNIGKQFSTKNEELLQRSAEGTLTEEDRELLSKQDLSGIDSYIAATSGNGNSVLPSGSTGSTVVSNSPSITMNVQAAPGMDTEQFAELASQKAGEKVQQVLNNAFDATRGGRR